MWLKLVGLFTGECSFGFAFVGGALAGRVTGPTFEANLLKFTARAGFSCMKGPAIPFGNKRFAILMRISSSIRLDFLPIVAKYIRQLFESESNLKLRFS